MIGNHGSNFWTAFHRMSSRNIAATHGEYLNILLFEDKSVNNLVPASSGRAAFTISCAGYRLVDLVKELSATVSAAVRSHLVDVTHADRPDLSKQTPSNEPCLCVNGRLAPTHANLALLKEYLSRPVGWMATNDFGVLAAVVDGPQIDSISDGDFSTDAFRAAGCQTAPDESAQLDSIDQLHDLVRVQCASLGVNLEQRIVRGSYHEVADGVFSADPGFVPGAHVVTCTRNGPIVLESGCSIGPFSFLEGPVYLGSNCKVAEHSAIKDGVSAGTTCKLGGEIEATIIESFSNKQHHGFLGHSYLGSWINLGAGTCNSDLKNTYGKVNMQRSGQKIATGMQFVGCFIGDYAKTAINTSIFTGKTIGACSMVYGIAANDVVAFTNDARLLGKVTEIDPGVMIQTQARMFARRNVTQRECDKALIEAMFRLTADQRDGLVSEPLVF